MNNLDARYQALLEDILHLGVAKSDRTGTGTISVFGRQIRHKMSEGFPLLTTKKMPFKLIAAELIWFLRGDTNIKFLLDNDCHIWDGDAYKNYKNKITKIFGDAPHFTQKEFINEIKTDNDFAKMWGDLGPIYGKQWRQWGGLQDLTDDDKPIYLDQIQNLINDLKTNPDSRRLMVSAWNVEELNQMVLPPCHYGFQLYTRELTGEERWDLLKERVGGHKFQLMVDDIVPFGGGLSEELQSYNIPKRAISLMWNQRSVDTFLGLPFNIASYGLLLEIIAKSVNMVSDELIGNLGDVHLYKNHIEQAKEQIDREPFKLPKLNINTEFWPTEGGECGIGLIDAKSVFEGFTNAHFCKCLLEDDIQLYDYQSHPTIKAPLSN
jgi:thymidylate synthase